MTRIACRSLDQMTDRARELTIERGNLNVYRALANADSVFTGWMEAGRAALTSPVLPARLREIVILRTAHLMDCPYEIAQHTTIAAEAGVEPHELAALARPIADGFGPAESAVLELTTQLVATRHAIAQALADVLAALGPEATVETLMLVNRWAGLALMLNALEVDLDTSARLHVPRE